MAPTSPSTRLVLILKTASGNTLQTSDEKPRIKLRGVVLSVPQSNRLLICCSVCLHSLNYAFDCLFPVLSTHLNKKA